MKSTIWIYNKLQETNKQLDLLEKQISDRKIKEEDYDNFLWHHNNGRPSEITITQWMWKLLGQKSLLEDILH